MIDIENEVFSTVEASVREAFPDVFMTGEYIPSVPCFPCVTLTEADNIAYERTQDSGSGENHVQVMYEANVYSNKTVGKKAETKAIMAIIDEQMQSLGFTRIMLTPIPNENDSTVYRMTARYRAVVSADRIVHWR